MSLSIGGSERFIRDAEAHNQWWEGDASDLKDVTSNVGRSDLYQILNQFDRFHLGGTGGRTLGLYGQTGVGKSTVLKQLVAAILDDRVCDYNPADTINREYDVVGTTPPTQVLYIPVDDSLYGLESGERALTWLEDVVDYFRSHIVQRTAPHYVLLDDIDAIDVEASEIKATVNAIGSDNTFVVTTGTLQGNVGVPAADARPILPVKFVDFVEYGASKADPVVVNTVVDHRHYEGEGSGIKDLRRVFKSSSPDLERAAELFDTLYFDTFDETDRETLHRLSREYLRQGGLFYRSTATGSDRQADRGLRERYHELTDELIRSNLESFVYRKVAREASIKRPENLYKLCAMAATTDEGEVSYQQIADVLGVDRRTVSTYLETLADQVVVTESTDYSLRRHRRTRLYLRDPRHVTLLSQRQAHRGFESLTDSLPVGNARFERVLARTAAFDHLKRLRFRSEDTAAEQAIEHYETDAGMVDFIVRYGATVVPFVCTYKPFEAPGREVARAFDPSAGSHGHPDPETTGELHLEYEAPCRFVLTDRLSEAPRMRGSLLETVEDGTTLCHLPLWLFLLVC